MSEQYPVMETDQSDGDSTLISVTDNVSKRNTDLNPRIPFINQPKWKSMNDWTNMQRPTLVQLIQIIRERSNGTTTTGSTIENTAKNSKAVGADDEDNHFGILIFA
ncbi:jg23273 [Pararge aegeria aegeria]|uniref:Jg23273 protein n=1 Tax=Pararge aegeria aegeria TaxID=348720 RepID=A0A8S4RKB8_9NEOP|nr:jg23273 [Pararge aegeria aegeria]